MTLTPRMENEIPVIHPAEVVGAIGKVSIIDVRNPDEFVGELGHIRTARLVTLGPDLEKFLTSEDKNKEIVFVCRSGGRSGRATQAARAMGFLKSMNMEGGMLLWNEEGLEIE
ncbi:MAG: rhodanese-like domain-containing protein [Bdellovibrionales bacterium]|nr:rhodanese-like domain-containing protein [Bdellovibrionales bacterium]